MDDEDSVAAPADINGGGNEDISFAEKEEDDNDIIQVLEHNDLNI